ncbi:hypothetical protein WJX73_004542 [Symbiochloris irregularis]|uniref:Peptidase S8/S53 domain-containing protein n=1 Tax=Symbiochloris irregularis TaxID=706552 RepID=A0AAW1PTD7_9CHLO
MSCRTVFHGDCWATAALLKLQFEIVSVQAGIESLEVPEGDSLESWLSILNEHPGIEFAEEDRLMHAFDWNAPDDPDLPLQWAMYQLGLFLGQDDDRAWHRSTGSHAITVCIIDSGIDYDHPDLASNMWINHHEIPDNGIDDDHNGFIDDYYGFNFLNDSGDCIDNYFHGTHLAGIVGAACNNSLGVCGVSPNVNLMACKFLDAEGNGFTSNALRCLDYSLLMGADMTLNSWGGVDADSLSLRLAIHSAEAAGQLYITAAGNDWGADIDEHPTYPAAYNNSNILTVIATAENGQLAAYSNYGQTNAHIAAPGSHILSTVLDKGYGYHDGTSQAAAYVAGAAALAMAAYEQAGVNVSFGAAAIKAAILSGAARTPALADTCTSGGILDVAKALSLIPEHVLVNEVAGCPHCSGQLASYPTSRLETGALAPTSNPSDAASDPAWPQIKLARP